MIVCGTLPTLFPLFGIFRIAMEAVIIKLSKTRCQGQAEEDDISGANELVTIGRLTSRELKRPGIQKEQVTRSSSFKRLFNIKDGYSQS